MKPRAVYIWASVMLALLLAAPASARAQQQEGMLQWYDLSLGFNLMHLEGYRGALEYGTLQDSLALESEVALFPFPHRLHLELDAMGRHDSFFEGSYSYGDLLSVRALRRTLYHFLENQDISSGLPAQWQTQRLDEGTTYGIDAHLSEGRVRVKWPGYPLHLSVSTRSVERTGQRQLQYMAGSGWYDSAVLASRTQQIKGNLHELALSANGHFGYFEAELSTRAERYSPDGETVIAQPYLAAHAQEAVRPAGTYALGVRPKLKSSTTTLKAHTPYNGKLVLVTTLGAQERQNTTSSVKSEARYAMADAMWQPFPELAFNVKLSSRSVDVQQPDALPAGYLGLASYQQAIELEREALSSTKKTLAAEVIYRPARQVTVKLSYKKDTLERDNAQSWDLPHRSSSERMELMGLARFPGRVRLRGIVAHESSDEPHLATTPQSRDSALLHVSWPIAVGVNASMSYRMDVEQQRQVTVSDEVLPLDRHARRDRSMLALTYAPRKALVFSAAYAHMESEVTQDMALGSVITPHVRYTDDADNYVLSASYAPSKALLFDAAISLTESQSNVDAQGQALEASGAPFEMRQVEYSLSGLYRLERGWALRARARYMQYDRLEGQTDDEATLRSLTVMASRGW